MAQKRADRKPVVELGLAGGGLEQVDLDDAGPSFEGVQKREWIPDVLDHVERVCGVEPRRHIRIEVMDGGVQAPALEAPAQVGGAGVVELCELHR